MKTPTFGPVEMQSFNNDACVSCHMHWDGNADGMLSYNFGNRPVITEKCYSDSCKKQAYTSARTESLQHYFNLIENSSSAKK